MTPNDTHGRHWNPLLLSTPPQPSAVTVWPRLPGHLSSNKTVCYQGDRDGCGTTAFGVNPPHGLISDDCGECQLPYYLFIWLCSSLAKLASSKPGLRSKQERITPSVDRSTVGMLKGTTESIPDRVQHTIKQQGTMQHSCLSPQQFEATGEHTVAEFSYPRHNEAVIDWGPLFISQLIRKHNLT